MKREFTFHSSDFNCTESKDYFINPGCFGDDVCRWLMDCLQSRAIRTAEQPEQEDFGWFFTFDVSGVGHCVVILFEPIKPQIGVRWVGWVERHVGFLNSIFGGRGRNVLPEAIEIIDVILRSSEKTKNVEWREHHT